MGDRLTEPRIVKAPVTFIELPHFRSKCAVCNKCFDPTTHKYVVYRSRTYCPGCLIKGFSKDVEHDRKQIVQFKNMSVSYPAYKEYYEEEAARAEKRIEKYTKVIQVATEYITKDEELSIEALASLLE